MINAQIGPREDYTNAQIVINAPDEQDQPYQVLLDLPGWRSFPPCEMRLDATTLANALIDPEKYGRLLGEALFWDDGLGRSYSESLAVCQGRGDGLRVRLVINPDELQGIHWERIFHPIDGKWQPLGTTALTPFSRYLSAQQWSRPQPVIQRPLRILVVIASPHDISRAKLDPIKDSERKAMHELFDGLPDVTATFLESGTESPPTLDEIRKELAAGYNIVHFLCHGVETRAGTALFLEKKDGSVDIVTTERLVGAFKSVQSPPAFVFLTACESAARSRSDGFLPAGPALVQDGGVQAALAMTAKVGIEMARRFTAQFYIRLLKHGVVDLAVNEARALVRDDWDWGVPVLFSRLVDNQLLDFPIGKIYDVYLSHTDRAFAAVDEAIQAARFEEHGQELLRQLEDLVTELRKSHGALVDVASRFRRTGQDPKTFDQLFRDYYYDFKEYYDQQTWIDEQTSCSRIYELRGRILPRLSPILSDAAMDSLRQELDVLSNFDMDLVHYFQEYLDGMNSAVDSIWQKLAQGDVDEAIHLKTEFEAQISPSFQRSKQMFERMGSAFRGVSRA